MRGEIVDEEGSPIVVLALAKELPDIRILQCGEGCDFELEEMILVGAVSRLVHDEIVSNS